ncbi:hypothetical protein DKX38_001183 [Salix brachista]|uniref:Uncharacterized protein n=1 Tax=Salix brachista TaxID=2182728 RepID=A0A5N5P3D8_9ROSI|nr:hypothetical protein DKX38_001183 [Salix brachista]
MGANPHKIRFFEEHFERELDLVRQCVVGKANEDILELISKQAVQNLKDERHAAVQQTQLLQQELDLLRRRRYRKTDPGFSLMFAFVVGLVGIIVGFLLNLSLSSPSTN